jgi:hypothetical protein
MQDRYCGDVGDFGKYGLLRWVCRDTHLRLGVNWYLVPDESGNADGRHTRYLDPTEENKRRFRECDRKLWEALGKIIRDNHRRVQRIRTDKILPRGTVFYEDVLRWPADMRATSPGGIEARKEHRQAWVERGQQKLRDCELVFFDPDNGLETKTKRYKAKGPKYVFFDEIRPYYARGSSVVIYQQMNHLIKAVVQVRDRLRDIKEKLNAKACFALVYHRGTARAFFIVATPEHAEVLKASAMDFVASHWGQHFGTQPSEHDVDYAD